jgi:hypothetical protein
METDLLVLGDIFLYVPFTAGYQRVATPRNPKKAADNSE